MDLVSMVMRWMVVSVAIVVLRWILKSRSVEEKVLTIVGVITTAVKLVSDLDEKGKK